MKRTLVILEALVVLAAVGGGGVAVGMTIEDDDVDGGRAETGTATAVDVTVRRGDVIVFERPPSAPGNGEDDTRYLEKRVIATGGDTAEGRDGIVYVNDERVDEPYLVPGTPTDNLPRQTVPDGYVFVLGDTRTDTEDSRVFGPVDEVRIVGRVTVPTG